MNEVQITTKRLLLKPMSLAFLTEGYLSWLIDTKVNRHITHKNLSQSGLTQYILDKINNPNCRFWAICTKNDDSHIGNVKLEPIDWTARTATFGIMIGDSNYWGKGIATEVTSAVAQHSFFELGLLGLNLGVAAQNTAAVKAYEKCGFKVIKSEQSHDIEETTVIKMRLELTDYNGMHSPNDMTK